MKVQSQILQFKCKSDTRSGFLVMEVLVALLFCFTFILVLLKFHSDILLLYERFFVRNIALDLAVNSLEKSVGMGLVSSEQKVVYGGRTLNLAVRSNREYEYIDDDSKKSSRSKVVVVWKNSSGRDEKLTMGSA